MLRNIAFLYFSYAISLAAPLVLLPILGPRLGVSGWGIYTVAQTISVVMVAVSDFGFHVSGVRSMARSRESAFSRSEIFIYTNLIKVLLALVGAALIFSAYYCSLLPKFGLLILISCVVSGALQGMSLAWYYQGIERMMLPSFCDALGEGIVVAVTSIFVKGVADIWICFAAQALVAGVNFLVLMASADVRPSRHSIKFEALIGQLRDAAPMGLLHLLGTLLGGLQPLALGKLATPYEVGRYGASEKISRAVYSVAQPIRFAFFPRISKNVDTNSPSERNLVLSSLIMIGLSVVGGLVIVLYAGNLLRVIFGREFAESADVLRILALLPVLTAVREGFVTQYFIANKCEPLLIKILCGTFGFGAIIIWLLRANLSAPKMATVLILSEFLFVVTGLTFLWRRRLNLDVSVAVNSPDIQGGSVP